MAAENESDNQAAKSGALSGGNYELIRNRLIEQSKSLRVKADSLNQKRLDTFGKTQMQIIGNLRVRTENNCVPRDIVEVGEQLLFGYNVFLGLKPQTQIEDVISLHSLAQGADGWEVQSHDNTLASLLDDASFKRDFEELYQFYKDAKLLQLRNANGRLLAIFQYTERVSDLRVFRWNLDASGKASYLDNRGERDHIFPPSHDFEWTRTTRANQVQGSHPHISILDEVFIETIGGDLTIKVENNTEAGQGVYSEPVDDAYQSLDDGEIHYAKVGVLILIKVRPYREEQSRYLVFNTRTQEVTRLDAMGQACLQLPEDHGIIFPGGFYLQSGDTKTFEGVVEGMEFKRMVRSPNGEDVLYIFHRRDEGLSILLNYNLIRKEVQPPLYCHGYSLFEDGRLVVFKAASDEPSRVHPMQIWQTPYFSDSFAASVPSDGSFFSKLGNAELVRGISDLHSVRRMINQQQPTVQIYEDLIRAVSRIIDNYHWLSHEEVDDILPLLKEVHSTAELIVDEYEKVMSIRKRAEEAVQETNEQFRKLMASLRPDVWEKIDDFVTGLDSLRRLRGHVISLKEMRYIDLEHLEDLDGKLVTAFDDLTQNTVLFLLKPDALQPYLVQIDTLHNDGLTQSKTTELQPMQERLDSIGAGLDLLTEVISGLKIEDPTQRTQILEGISEVFAHLNRTRATLVNHRKSIATQEGSAEFSAEYRLFSQGVTAAVAQADTPVKCDEQLSRLMVQLEELEARFSEFDEFLEKLTEKREEVYETFEGRKQSLVEARQRRSQNISRAADRILQGIARRAQGFQSLDDLNTYFASDAMIMKVGDLCEQLRDIDDSVRADELESKLKSAKQDAIRALRDKNELFEEGAAVVKFGKHRFSVNTQPLELTLITRDDEMLLHITGTDYFETINSPELNETRKYWEQELVSETNTVYRGEFLASSILFKSTKGEDGFELDDLLARVSREESLLPIVQKYSAERYDEGYERGVHDYDGALILQNVLQLWSQAGLLRFGPNPRALAALFWSFYDDKEQKQRWTKRARSMGRLRDSFADGSGLRNLSEELSGPIEQFADDNQLPTRDQNAQLAAQYLCEELLSDRPHFVLSKGAESLATALERHLDRHNMGSALQEDLRAFEADLPGALQVASAWVESLVNNADTENIKALTAFIPETTSYLVCGKRLDWQVQSASTLVDVESLLGQHRLIKEQTLSLHLDEFLQRLTHFHEKRVPGFRAYRELRQRITSDSRDQLRLDEFKPRVLSSFVRNKLINDAYLPLIGDNLAKQMGAMGAGRRTDLMGILLLISPPGYGKTTLMEYVANRLGLVFMKVNGPSLGHGVTSIDPNEATSATARQEVEKINLALEMGNNVMLYLDDIQHTNPELLQKFISLCDAQRRIEGVWRGKTQTYDLRGKKFCVVMAGNPYTESGDRFQIPDMLSNRADTYNLGDVLDGKEDIFALSYIENALTSNTILAPLATREQGDVYKLLDMAKGEEINATDLSHDYSNAELEEFKSVFQKLFRVQEVLLKVNLAYIHSAAQEEAYRTEPPFKLQGSYRNMSKVTEKIVSALNDDELERMITDHYLGEAQTLTTGAEQNLLKLAELQGNMTEVQGERWEDIKKTYGRIQSMGEEEDPVKQAVGYLSSLVLEVENLGTNLAQGQSSSMDLLAGHIETLRETVESSPTRSLPDTVSQVVDTLQSLQKSIESSPSNALPDSVDSLTKIAMQVREDLLQSPANELPAVLKGLAQTADGMWQDNRESPTHQLPGKLSDISESLRAVVKTLSEEGTPSAIDGLKDTVSTLNKTMENNSINEHLEQLTLELRAFKSSLDNSPSHLIPNNLSELKLAIDAVVQQLQQAETNPNTAYAAELAKHLGEALSRGPTQGLQNALSTLGDSLNERQPSYDISQAEASLQGIAKGLQTLVQVQHQHLQIEQQNTVERSNTGPSPEDTIIAPRSPQEQSNLQQSFEQNMATMNKHLDLIARILFSNWKSKNTKGG